MEKKYFRKEIRTVARHSGQVSSIDMHKRQSTTTPKREVANCNSIPPPIGLMVTFYEVAPQSDGDKFTDGQELKSVADCAVDPLSYYL